METPASRKQQTEHGEVGRGGTTPLCSPSPQAVPLSPLYPNSSFQQNCELKTLLTPELGQQKVQLT